MLAKHGFLVADWGQTLNRGGRVVFASKTLDVGFCGGSGGCSQVGATHRGLCGCHPPSASSTVCRIGAIHRGLWIGATHRGLWIGATHRGLCGLCGRLWNASTVCRIGATHRRPGAPCAGSVPSTVGFGAVGCGMLAPCAGSVPPNVDRARIGATHRGLWIGATHRGLCRAVGGGRVGSRFSLGSSQILITFEAVFRPIVPFGLPKSPSIRQIIGPFRFRTLCILVA